MSSSELYFRHGPFAYVVKLDNWTDPEAGRKAAEYLARYVRSSGKRTAGMIHAALMHEQEHPEADAGPYAATIHEIRDREGGAFLEAVSDWLFRPSAGHSIKLRAAGDAGYNND